MLKNSTASINVVRIIYLMVCELAGVLIALKTVGYDKIWLGVTGGLLVALFFILVESLTKKFTLRGFSHATFGLLVGFVLAWLVSTGISNLVEIIYLDKLEYSGPVLLSIHIGLFASMGFLGSTLALRSGSDDFALLIPYVRFRGEITPGMPILLDKNIIMDNRLLAVLDAGFIDGKLIIPRFVVEELYVMAKKESSFELTMGQRGLNNLELLRSSDKYHITIQDIDGDENKDNDDNKLIQICKLLSAKLLTIDDHLGKSARLLGVTVLNINELNQSLTAKISIGERLKLPLVKIGKDKTQAIGYLPDGSMIVVNAAADKINTTQEVIVISTLDTDSGTLIFAELFEDKKF